MEQDLTKYIKEQMRLQSEIILAYEGLINAEKAQVFQKQRISKLLIELRSARLNYD